MSDAARLRQLAVTDPAKLRQQAEVTCRRGWFSTLLGGPRFEQACELFVAAANKYKLRGDWISAAECYTRAAEMQRHLGDNIAEANFWMECGHVYRKINTQLAGEQYEKASTIYTDTGRFPMAGKLMKALADEYEKAGELLLAAKYYKQAADYFGLDELSKTSTSQCRLKYAELTARAENNYDEAIKIFEDQGAAALQSDLLKFGAKEHFFKAGILWLVKGDAITASVKCEQYGQTDPLFAASREGRLLKNVCDAFEQSNTEEFVDKLAEHDRITRLDSWKVYFFNKVKAMMPALTNGAADPVLIPPTMPASVQDATGDIDLT